MSNDLRTEKEILHEIELDVDKVKTDLEKAIETINHISDNVWGENQFRSPYGKTTLRGRIGRNVEELLRIHLDKHYIKMEEKLESLNKDNQKIFSPMQLISFAIMVVGAGALMMLLT